MFRIGVFALGAALALGGACSKNGDHDTSPEVGEQDTESGWDEAWDMVEAGGHEVVEAGEWTWEKTKDGAIAVWHGTKKVGGKVGQEVSDTAILTSIKSQLAAADDVDATHIDVDVDEGVVELQGKVESSREARRAMKIALDTSGVDKVVSRLRWPRQ